MQMVGHIVDRNQLLFLTRNDTGDVFLQLVVAFRRDQVLPAFDGKHSVNIYLRIGIGHAPMMSLLTELENIIGLFSTKMSRLRRFRRLGKSVYQSMDAIHTAATVLFSNAAKMLSKIHLP